MCEPDADASARDRCDSGSMRLLYVVTPVLFATLACGSSDGGGGDQSDASNDDTQSSTDGVSTDAPSDSKTSDTSPTDAHHDGTSSDAATDAPTDGTPPPPTGLHVEGAKLVDKGATVRLLGVNHSGAEYACVQGYAITEGPDASTVADAMLTWKVNTVRMPVNEQCWLGINGINPSYSGDPYRTAITAYVKALRDKGLYVIFDLHWAAPSTSQPKGQLPMADKDHALDFWKSAAATFKDDPGVLFDVFNEPFIDTSNASTSDAWDCLQHGCSIKAFATGGDSYPSYTSAGTQDLVDAIRSTGATNVIMIPGLAWTNDLSGWLTHKPTDSTGNLVALLHLYNFNSCSGTGCWNTNYDPIAKSVPLVTGELGENDCGHGFIDGYMTWADARGISYNGWTWNTWSCTDGPALITAYDGTPTAFGAGYRDHLKSL